MTIRFKQHFKNLNFYSMPESILFVFRKRLNLILLFATLVVTTFFSIL